MDLITLKDMPPWEWPEDTAEMLLEILRHEGADESGLLLAAELAGDMTVINDELAAALLALASNARQPEILRSEAVLSLGPVLEYADLEGFESPDDVPISEKTYVRIQQFLREVFMDADVSELLRRKALETSSRSPQDWHPDAIRKAYSSGAPAWILTAVHCMCFIPGFGDQILEALESNDEDIQYEAVLAAGNWEVDDAWSHIASLVTDEGTDKILLLAAMDAVASIRPREAVEILMRRTESGDEDIVEAAHEAIAMAGAYAEEEEEDARESLH